MKETYIEILRLEVYNLREIVNALYKKVDALEKEIDDAKIQ